jgi:beta-glucanase (GH16 family)
VRRGIFWSAATVAGTILLTLVAIAVLTNRSSVVTHSTPAASGAITPRPPAACASATAAGAIFDDEFNCSSLDTSKWVALNRPGDSSNSERECYLASNVTEGNGVLTLDSTSAPCMGLPYSSGAVQWRSFSFTYGTLEFRSKEAGGTGTWPAEWLLGTDCQQSNVSLDNPGSCHWPNPGSDEIDVAEILGGDHSKVSQGIHSAGASPNCLTSVSADVSQNWHTYDLVWSKDSLVWKIDGVTTCTVAEHVPTTPMFLIINTAVGGSGAGNVDSATLPQIHQIDYVRVYR